MLFFEIIFSETNFKFEVDIISKRFPLDLQFFARKVHEIVNFSTWFLYNFLTQLELLPEPIQLYYTRVSVEIFTVS